MSKIERDLVIRIGAALAGVLIIWLLVITLGVV